MSWEFMNNKDVELKAKQNYEKDTYTMKSNKN